MSRAALVSQIGLLSVRETDFSVPISGQRRYDHSLSSLISKPQRKASYKPKSRSSPNFCLTVGSQMISAVFGYCPIGYESGYKFSILDESLP